MNEVMVGPEIDRELGDFLTERLDSFEQIAILLFLRERAESILSMQELAAALDMPVAVVVAASDHLARGGLLQRIDRGASARVRYGVTSSLGEVVDRLAVIYEQSPTKVIKIMNATSLVRVRRLLAAAMAAGAPWSARRRDG